MIVAKILGILGGLIALIVGIVGFSLMSGADSALTALSNTNNELARAAGTEWNSDSSAHFGSLRYVGLILPVVAIIGCSFYTTRLNFGLALAGGSAVLMIVMYGISFLSLLPVILIALSCFLAFSAGKNMSSEV